MTYSIDSADAIESYYIDQGYPGNNPFRGDGTAVLARLRQRFSLTEFLLPGQAPSRRPGHSFVRTADRFRSGWDFEIRVPFSLATGVLAALPIAWIAFHAWQGWRKRRRASRSLCQQCGYDIRASESRCPECGNPIGDGFGATNSANATR
ncbi:MAG TPA: hypothetical protein VH475_05215 [Tepidisphaeraceae bacterium]|jgi:hypothetical protein